MNAKKTVALTIGGIALAAVLVFAGIGIHSTYASSQATTTTEATCNSCCK